MPGIGSALRVSRSPTLKPSRFIAYAERKLGRPLTQEERKEMLSAREEAKGSEPASRQCARLLEALLKHPF